MTDDKLALDKKTLGALSSDTRANILKSLDVRRMTVSELSKRLNLPKSTIHENLVGGIIERCWFIKSAFPEKVMRGVPLYEPKYLIFGVILLSLGVLFLYLAFRMRKVKEEHK